MQDKPNSTATARIGATAGTVRLLRPSEEAQFRNHLLRLDAASRRDRFNGTTSDTAVISYARRCFKNGAVVIGYVEDGLVLGAAELHECTEDKVPTGEIAFSVERHMQCRGLGRLLFSRLIEGARAFGYERLKVTTHPGNQPMKQLARSFGARLRFVQGETVGMIEVDSSSQRLAISGAAIQKKATLLLV